MPESGAMQRTRSVPIFIILPVLLLATQSSAIDCGGELTKQASVITSPNFPQAYPDNARCDWTISVADGQVIDLSFQRLDLQRNGDQNCRDYLAVYDGPNTMSPLIQSRLCGYQDPSMVSNIKIRSRGNSLFLQFFSDSSESWTGFSAEYQALACSPFTYGDDECNTPCLCNQTNTLYCNNLNGDCVCKDGWIGDKCIVDDDECRDPNSCKDVYSECVNTPGSFECNCRGGLTKDASGHCTGFATCPEGMKLDPANATHCIASSICPKGMKTDPANATHCIECEDWTFGEECSSRCACDISNTQSCNKTNGLCHCYLNWTSSNCREDVNECLYDDIACNLTWSQCHNLPGSYECVCKAGYEKADSSQTVCEECGRIYTEPSGTIVSMKGYDGSGDDCSWTIRVAETQHVISLTVSVFRRVSGSTGYLRFYDGASSNGNLIESRTSSSSSYIIRSSGNEMYIVLYQPTSSQGTVIEATYWSHECPEGMYGTNCTTPCRCSNHTAHCDNIRGTCTCEDGWRSTYCSEDIDECWENPRACPDYSDCTNLNGSYVCTCKEGLIEDNGHCVAQGSDGIGSTGSSHLPLCVEIDQGHGTSKKLCYCPIGKELDGDKCVDCKNMTYGPDCGRTCLCNTEHTTSCNPVYGTCSCASGWTGDTCYSDVNECSSYRCSPRSYSTCHNTPGSFYCTCTYSDGYVQSGEHTCEKINCSYTYTSASGNISSPDYPDNYFNNADCSWLISVDEGHVISLRFDDFHTEIRNDYVKIFDGVTENAPVIGYYYGNDASSVMRPTRSTGNKMYIIFHSDGSARYRGFTGAYVSHPCQEFTYGEVDCDTLCPCERLNTFHCENTNGWCLCKDGWTGSDCTENVNECLGTNVDLCPENSDCEDTVGSYTCVCHPGYVFNDTTQICDVKNECTTKPCSHSCIITDEKEEQCVCPDDLVLDRVKNLTCVVPYYPYGTTHGDNSLDTEGDDAVYYRVSAPIRFSSELPIGQEAQSVAFVLTSGVISFGISYVPASPDLKWAASERKNFVAPFWARINKDSGQTYYQLYEKCPASGKTPPSNNIVMKRAEEDITKFFKLQEFEVNAVLVVTWEAVEPVGSQDDEQNTFQGIYISGWKKEVKSGMEVLSDEQTAYVIFLYQYGMMNWTRVVGRTIEVGTAVTGLSTSANIIRTPAEMLSKLPGNTGYNGVLTFEVGRVGGDRQKCHKYVCSHAELLSDPVYEGDRNQLFQCPCTLERLGRQWQLLERRGEKNEIYCYAISMVAKQRLLRGNYRNKLCCYKWVEPETSNWQVWEQARREAPFVTGHVLINDPWLLHNFDNFQALENIQAQQWCCNDVYSTELCERFYKVFPKQECTNFVNFVVASALGDPHITTLDGLTYTMNGWGEYVMLDIPTENFTLQARTGRAESSKGSLTNATVFTAFAAKESNYSSFQVELASTNTTMIIFANGEDVTRQFYDGPEFNRATETLSLSREQRPDKTVVIATFPCGVTMKVNVAVKCLHIEFEVEHALQNNTRGLLGYYNGQKEDDFTLPDGTVLSVNISERDIFQLFGKSWQVTAENSVFKYEAGENATDYQHPDFVPMFRDEVDPEAVAEAEKVCGGTQNDACIFDYLVTRDTAFAENTKQSKERNDMVLKSLENNPPNIEIKSGNINSNNQLIIHNGTETRIEYQAKDVDAADEVDFELVTSIDVITMDEPGIIVFSPYLYDGSDFHDTLGVRAKDSSGGYSAVIYTQLLICTGCSGHGQCSDTTVRERKPGDSFFKLACNCLPAYTGDDCESEVDACESKPCFWSQNCTDLTAAEQGNSPIGYRCGSCPPGFKNDNELCIDIDECSKDHICEHQCTNTEGSYLCECHDGYRVDPDDKSKCQDIDECGEKLSNCESTCINHPGNFTCDCWKNYTLRDDGHTCRAAFPKGHVCIQKLCDQKCEEVDGKATCSCGNGFIKDPTNETRCLDMNECGLDNMPCTQKCNNTLGSYSCSCYPGYTLNADRVSCSPCKEPYYGENCANVCQCSGRGTCDPFRGCVCDDAWTGTNCEIDVDECRPTNPTACPLGLVCQNEIGSYSCLCPEGYQKTDTGTCEDIDECLNLGANITCDLRVETCENTVGSYRCSCHQGYALEGSECQDINECATRGDACEQVCENVPGSYNCFCYPGYKLAADRRSCVRDRDFCRNSHLNCSHICSVDKSGLPSCDCPRGYQLIGSETCEDIDECASSDTNDCSYKDKYCINTEGSYQCSCPAGYRLDNDGRSCHACTGDTWGLNCANSCACGVGTDYCNSTTGCVCQPGFTGQHCTEDINECLNGQVTCSPKEICLNKPGSAACVCKVGYMMQNGSCVDIDECADPGTNTCPHNCDNSEGGFSCSCFPGYTFDTDSNTCLDVNECSGRAQCQQICTNTEGSYRCSCQSGLLLQPDGISCDSSLPCPANHNCSDQCINLDGNLTCLCPRGKVLSTDDPSLCQDEDLCATAPCSDGCIETNVNRSFQCVCRPGQHLEADHITCSDCPEGKWGMECSNQCQCEKTNTDSCNKVNGSCTCKTGWKGDLCDVDIDECEDPTTTCPAHALCHNTDGGYLCICDDGYFNTDILGNGCKECDGSHYGSSCSLECTCGEHEDCNKVNGSCTCTSGWTGPDCNTDVDECHEGPDTCQVSKHEECKNTDGSFDCVCHNGYERPCSSCECTDIDECRNSSQPRHDCSQLCINEVGGFRCDCREGFTYKEAENKCEDKDECSLGTAGCQQLCDNTLGGFTCSCYPGYYLDGTECIKITTSEAEIIFDYDTTDTNFTKGSTDMEELTSDIETKMLSKLKAQGLIVVSVTVIDLRKGSLIALLSIEAAAKTGNASKELTSALLLVMDDGPVILYNKPAGVIQVNRGDILFFATESKCERRQKFDPCSEQQQCVESKGVASCKSLDDEDDEELILGFAVGIPLFVIVCVTIIIIVVCWATKQKKWKLAAQEELRREREEKEAEEKLGKQEGMMYSSLDGDYITTVSNVYGYDTLSSKISKGSSWLDHPMVNQQGRPVLLRQQIELAALRTDYRGFNKIRDLHNSQQKQVARPAPTDHDYTYIYKGEGIYEALDDPAAADLEPDYGRNK